MLSLRKSILNARLKKQESGELSCAVRLYSPKRGKKSSQAIPHNPKRFFSPRLPTPVDLPPVQEEAASPVSGCDYVSYDDFKEWLCCGDLTKQSGGVAATQNEEHSIQHRGLFSTHQLPAVVHLGGDSGIFLFLGCDG